MRERGGGGWGFFLVTWLLHYGLGVAAVMSLTGDFSGGPRRALQLRIV